MCASAWAHFPEGVVYPIFQWPDGYEPVVDGYLDEWDIVPSRYVLTYASTIGAYGGYFAYYPCWLIDPGSLMGPGPVEVFETGDFGIVRVIAGWSEGQNKLYFAAEILDDVHRIDREPMNPQQHIHAFTEGWGLWTDDDFEIRVDADHSGGQYNHFKRYLFEGHPSSPKELTEEEVRRLEGAQAQQYLISVPPPDEYPLVVFTYATWSWKPPWTEVGWHMEGDFDGPNRTFYEVALTPFDDLNWVGPDLSGVHDLTEGEIIGLDYQFIDHDRHALSYDHWIRVFSTASYTSARADFSDARLVPIEESVFESVSLQDVTWGRIKASFRSLTP